MASFVIVDDFSSAIVYSAGWQTATDGNELNGTKHGADKAGMTATFEFTGTLITVVGSLGSVDVYGIPSTSYTIDGAALAGYVAPVIAPGLFQSNVTFFTSPSLTAGTHTLIIANRNGTAPNVFWLDYLAYLPSTTASTSDAATTTGTVPSQGTGTIDSQPRAATKSHTGAIAGGVVGGLVVLGLLAALVWRRFLRRRNGGGVQFSSPNNIRPFAAWRGDGPARRVSLLPASSTESLTPRTQTTERLEANTRPTSQTSLTAAPPAFSPATVTRQAMRRMLRSSEKDSLSTRAALRAAPALPQATVVQEVDSGARAVGPGVTVLPPPYTRH